MTFKTIFGRTAFLAAALALSLMATSEARAACEDPADHGVDWSGCDKSYADHLVDANLDGADLTGADLSFATWTDGRGCAEWSIGACN
jgi:uncharacterized protein YjbI with pentapeptide repeats